MVRGWLYSPAAEIRGLSGASSSRDLKRLYQTYFEWLVALLDQRDPVVLVDDDNPGREYEIEARMMVPLVASERSADNLAKKIHSVFVDYFDSSLAGDITGYVPIAVAVIQKWDELRASPQR